jgi:hypothetical protein
MLMSFAGTPRLVAIADWAAEITAKAVHVLHGTEASNKKKGMTRDVTARLNKK